jgi:hypothetical protein
VLAPQAAIESLAGRIERAYRLQRPQGYFGCSTRGVWATAAALLYRIHQDHPEIPLDPELFVAVQPGQPLFNDPWVELTQPAAARRYRSRIRQIVRELEGELRNEVLRAEGRIRRGEAVDRILLRRSQSLSPLGCFIVARRAGRTDLADHFRAEAIGQHRSCPLYRQATTLRLLPPGDYPVAESLADGTASPTERLGRPQVHLN